MTINWSVFVSLLFRLVNASVAKVSVAVAMILAMLTLEPLLRQLAIIGNIVIKGGTGLLRGMDT